MNHEVLARNWWVFALRGVFAIIFGVLAFLWPFETAWVLAILFAAYMLVDGIFAIVSGVRAAQRHERWWPFILEGVANLAIGVIATVWTGITVLALVYMLAIWAIFTGVVLLVPAFRPSWITGGRWLVGICGAISILLGILIIAQPIAGILALAWWVGGYAIAFGVFMLALGIRLKRERDNPTTPATAGAV